MNLVEVDVGVVVDMAVVEAEVGLAVVFPTMKIALLVRVPLRREILEDPLKGVVDMVDLGVLSVAVVVVNSVMGKLVMENDLAGHLNAIVELGAGEYCFSTVHLNAPLIIGNLVLVVVEFLGI